MAERRAHQPKHDVEHGKPDQRDHDIEGERVVEADRPDAAALQAAEAVFAAGHLAPAEGDGVGQRGERQRQQREVDAAPAQDDDARDRRQHGYRDHRQQQRQPDLAAEPVQLDQARGIGADAEPGGVAERHQPGVADAQIERRGRDRENHYRDRGVQRQVEQLHDERQRDQREARDHQRSVFLRGRDRHSNFSIRSPSSPRGRSISTTNIST